MREPINSLTHLAGVFLSLLGAILLLIKASKSTIPFSVTSAIVYSLGLLLLYGASSLYHAYTGKKENLEKLRILDHSMIYVLIAASYTPLCLVGIRSTMGYILLAFIWVSALAGIILKLTYFSVPRWLYTGIYLVLGWSAVILVRPLYQKLQLAAVVFLLAGGISYSIGAIIYARKNKRIQIAGFGFHEIFHLFILLGSILHYITIYVYTY
ncbi:hemolysin III family protein [Clostridia bacterium]|nr:hemolysin III family protein [Clostridia bacterium]